MVMMIQHATVSLLFIFHWSFLSSFLPPSVTRTFAPHRGRALKATLTDVKINEEIGRGSYGVVYRGTDRLSSPIILKRPFTMSELDDDQAAAQRCQHYFDVERAINSKIKSSSTPTPNIVSYRGDYTSPENENVVYICFEKVETPKGQTDSSIKTSSIAQMYKNKSTSTFLLQLLQMASTLKQLNIIHRDFKPANILFDTNNESLTLIDFGSAADLESNSNKPPFNLFGNSKQNKFDVAGLDNLKVAVSPIFSAPEVFVSNNPFAFDVFSIGMIFAMYAFDFNRDDLAMASFRNQLEECSYDLNKWVQRELGATLLDEKVLVGLELLDGKLFNLLSRMLIANPAKRISVEEALIVVESLDTYAAGVVDSVYDDSCEVVFDDDDGGKIEVNVSMRTSESLGIVLVEEADGVFVTSLEPRKQAAVLGKLEVDDKLVSVNGVSVGGSYDRAVELIRGCDPSEATSFVFQRSNNGNNNGDGDGDGDGNNNNNKIDTASPRLLKARTKKQNRGRFQALGNRKYQEDKILFTEVKNDENKFLLGVFDGHGGDEASTYARDKFELMGAGDELETFWSVVCEDYVAECSANGENCTPKYEKIFGFLRASVGGAGLKAGTTACVALFDKTTYTCAILNCGDSRAIVGDIGGNVKLASHDHKPSDAIEMKRIQENGGQVVCVGKEVSFRVTIKLGSDSYNYAVARSLEVEEVRRQGISAKADLFSVKMDNAGDFLVIATDGLIDVFDNNEICEFIASRLLTSDSVDIISEDLIKAALKRGAADNLSVVVYSAI